MSEARDIELIMRVTVQARERAQAYAMQLIGSQARVVEMGPAGEIFDAHTAVLSLDAIGWQALVVTSGNFRAVLALSYTRATEAQPERWAAYVVEGPTNGPLTHWRLDVQPT